MRWVAILVVSGCGRVAFDPLSDGGGTADVQSVDAPDVIAGLVYRFAFDIDATTDSQANYNGTCSACPALVPGLRGQAAQFTGIECIQVPAGGEQPQVFTFAVWAQLGRLEIETIFSKPRGGATSGNNSFELWSSNVADSVMVELNNLQNIGVSRMVGSWHHHAGVYDGATLSVYYDGGLVSSTGAPSVNYLSDPVRIGCDHDFGALATFFVGLVDEVRFYNRALSAAELAIIGAP